MPKRHRTSRPRLKGAAIGVLLAILWLLPAAGGAAAEAQAPADYQMRVDVELLLAVDVSPSVDSHEADQQRQGYLAALAAPEVIAAIASGPLGRIAVTYVEWAGNNLQRRVVNWRIIQDEASALAFRAQLAAQTIGRGEGTSISALIDFARRDFRDNGILGNRRVVDISGDGPNSLGRPVTEARDSAVAEGIVINGLAIQNSRMNADTGAPTAFLDQYYEDRVIGGPGAFSLVADFDNFAPILLQKLLREITGSSFQLSQDDPAASH